MSTGNLKANKLTRKTVKDFLFARNSLNIVLKDSQCLFEKSGLLNSGFEYRRVENCYKYTIVKKKTF